MYIQCSGSRTGQYLLQDGSEYFGNVSLVKGQPVSHTHTHILTHAHTHTRTRACLSLGGEPGEGRELLQSNQMLALGASHTPSGRSGSLQLIHRPIRSQVVTARLCGVSLLMACPLSQLGDLYATCSSHYTNHILGLLEVVATGKGDLVVSVLVDQVAPHLPPDSSPWLPGDGPRSTSLEW